MKLIKIKDRSPIHSKRKFWYFITYYECPVCGHQDVVVERRYGPRPENYDERNEFIEHYDWCQE